MLLKFKTLEQKTFEIDIDASLTVTYILFVCRRFNGQILDVKQRIETDHTFPVSCQKLIHSGTYSHQLLVIYIVGKILADDVKLETLKVGEKDFIVCMVTKVSIVINAVK
jgi:hypothetical protein